MVLEKVAQAVDEARVSVPPQKSRSDKGMLLEGASDWKVAADIPNKRCYPDMIKDNSVRPDIVLSSDESKKVVII